MEEWMDATYTFGQLFQWCFLSNEVTQLVFLHTWPVKCNNILLFISIYSFVYLYSSTGIVNAYTLFSSTLNSSLGSVLILTHLGVLLIQGPFFEGHLLKC